LDLLFETRYGGWSGHRHEPETSGRDMLEAWIAGETDANPLAELARLRLREKIPALRLALQGRVTDHHRFLLRRHRDPSAHLEALMARLGARLEDPRPLLRKCPSDGRRFPGSASGCPR